MRTGDVIASELTYQHLRCTILLELRTPGVITRLAQSLLMSPQKPINAHAYSDQQPTYPCNKCSQI